MASDGERHRPYTAVFLVLREDDRVLLSQRKNTGHRDGEYGLVAGHVEPGESATEAMAREAREEAGITVDPDALELVHLVHRDSGDRVYYDVFFTADDWEGPVRNREPEKCADLSWFRRSALPENTVPYVEQALTATAPYSEFGWSATHR